MNGEEHSLRECILFMCAILTMILLAICVLLLVMGDISAFRCLQQVVSSGYSAPSLDMLVLVLVSLLILSFIFVIPAGRWVFRFFPWLEPLIVTFAIDSLIFTFAVRIINGGYRVYSPESHTLYSLIAVVWVIAARLLQCFMMHKVPVSYIGATFREEGIKPASKACTKRTRKRVLQTVAFGIMCFLVARFGMRAFIARSTYSAINSTSREVDFAKESLLSDSLPPGTHLYETDSFRPHESRDYAVNGSGDEATTIVYIWDYANVDGDYIQAFVNGEPVTDIVMLAKSPLKIEVPAESTVVIRGIHDGDDKTITCGAYFELDGTSYFNVMEEGGSNTYTLAPS